METQSTLSCHSTEPEKIVSQGERLNAITAGGKYCFLCLIIGIALMIWGVLYLNGKINDAQLRSAEEITRIKTEYSIRLAAVEKTCEELKAECEQARRDYNSARSSMSQYRRQQRGQN